ncbi:MAG: SPOR domain-containing protein [Thiolinea sp.]
MKRQFSVALSRQRGITFWHVLLLVVVAVSLAVCAKNQSIPYLQKPIGDIQLPKIPRFNFQGSPNNSSGSSGNSSVVTSYIPDEGSRDENVEWLLASNKTVQVQSPPPDSAYEIEYPRNLSSGFYTVQVFSGYNSKSAYDLKKALQRDGYRAYIHQETTNQGILFKVRVGKYSNRSDAFAMNTKLKLSYPKTLSNSFVLLRR